MDTELELMAKQLTWEAEGILSITLVAPHGEALPRWEPGAHIDMRLRESLVRQYSLCGDPDDRHAYRVAVLREQAQLGGSEFVHENLRPGHHLTVVGPRNNFRFEPAHRYVFLAGGIGITPILPMVRQAHQSGADWRLHYGGRRRASMAFTDELAPFGDHVLLHPEDETGRLDLPALIGPPRDDTLVYACGPERLLQAAEETMRDWPSGALQTERFRARPRTEPATGDQAVEVVAQRSGRTVRVPADESFLGALERAGIDVPSSCRDGICGTCETAVLAGTPDHRDSILSDDERANGHTMMICVSRATTPHLTLDR